MLVSVSACSGQDPLSHEDNAPAPAVLADPQLLQRSEAEAKAEVQLFMEQLAPQVRGTAHKIASAGYVLSSEVAVRGSHTEAPPLDTLLYVLNVNDEKTAIVSGDLSSPAVLAVMEGKPQKDMLSQKTGTGFDFVAKNIVDYASSETARRKWHERRFYISYFKMGPWETIQKQEPMLQVAWHQYSPFNDSVQMINETRTPAGCVPVAVAQFLTYHKWPNSFSNHTWFWEEMVANTSHTDIPILLRALGQDLRSKYRENFTSTSASAIDSFLNSQGFVAEMKKPFFSADVLLNELQNKRPVFVWGENKKDTEGGSHVWIIDGFLKKERKLYKIYTNGTYRSERVQSREHRYYFHCNWGWGVCNGYFLMEAFLPFDMPLIPENNNRGDSIYKPQGREYLYNNYACIIAKRKN